MTNNMTLERDGSKLVITIDLAADGQPSASGKTIVLASTRGNQNVPDTVGVKLGLNLYAYEGYMVDAKPKAFGTRSAA
jgi:hypothetical protein